MENSELFESEEQKSNWKTYKIGALILGIAIFAGIVVLPMYVNGGSEVCISCDFFNALPNFNENIEQEKSDNPIVDVQKTSENVELSVTTGSIFSYEIIADGKWSGDYVDGKKNPFPIMQDGSMTFQFRCYENELLQTSTYFGTFKSLEGKPIKVKILSDGIVVHQRTSTSNQAIILEGSC